MTATPYITVLFFQQEHPNERCTGINSVRLDTRSTGILYAGLQVGCSHMKLNKSTIDTSETPMIVSVAEKHLAPLKAVYYHVIMSHFERSSAVA